MKGDYVPTDYWGNRPAAGVTLPGLPEGVLAVAVRQPEAKEYICVGGEIECNDFTSYPAVALIVAAAPGYKLSYYAPGGDYRPVKLLKKSRYVTVTFALETEPDSREFDTWLSKKPFRAEVIQDHPGA